MGRITLVTGGARSGKSRFAETLATQRHRVCYAATAEALDEEMAERIAKHRARRPTHWTMLEAPLDLTSAIASIQQADTVLLDCLSLWTSNRLLALGDDAAPDWWQAVATLEETLTAEARALCALARQADWDLVMVTNETGFGVVPASRLARAFRDLLGRLGQVVAADADTVYLVVAGLAVELKALAAR